MTTMLSVALTGNVASGKSTVARLFARWGAVVSDADALVRELQRPGEPVFAAIAERFGPRVLAADGTLDRAALRRLVLADPRALADLNAIVHPAVCARRAEVEAAARRQGARVIVHDIPLLFEAGDPESFDLVVLVEASEPVRRERLIRLRGLAPDEADRLMATQLPSPVKRERADIVIENDGDLPALEIGARDAWGRIRAAAAARA